MADDPQALSQSIVDFLGGKKLPVVGLHPFKRGWERRARAKPSSVAVQF